MSAREPSGGYDGKRKVVLAIICDVFIGFMCGFVGAGGGIMMLIMLWRNEVISPKGVSKRINKNVMIQCIRVGIPLAIQRLIVFSGYAAFTAEVAALGTTTLAAHSIAITSEEMFYIPGFGMQDAGSTLIGNAMG